MDAASPSVVEMIKARIRSGELAPGQRLTEARLSAEIGATRTRVREALQRLAGEGLVVLEGFRGASVKQLSPEEVRHVFLTRELLEGLAARQAAEAGADARTEVARAQAAMDAAEAAADGEAFAAANTDWHAAIIAASGNAYLDAFLERLWIPTFKLSFARTYTAEIMARSNGQHRLVTEAIVRGQPEAAELAMRLHVRSGAPD